MQRVIARITLRALAPPPGAQPGLLSLSSVDEVLILMGTIPTRAALEALRQMERTHVRRVELQQVRFLVN